MIFQYFPPILMYHSVIYEREMIFPGMVFIRPTFFAKQMNFLKKWNYRVVELDLLFDWIIEGKVIPPKTLSITFDDGWLDNYVNAFPILKKYGFPATIFLVTREINTRHYLRWEQIKEMESFNIRFGNHTHTHPHLIDRSLEEVKKEIEEAKKMLDSHLNSPSFLFSYPFGEYDDQIKKVVQECGYKGAVSTSVDAILPLDDRYAYRRLRLSPFSRNPLYFGLAMSGYYSSIIKMQKKIKLVKRRWLCG